MAPGWVETAVIQQFVLEKQRWIIDKLKKQSQRQAERPVRRYQAGEVFCLFDQPYTLVIEPGNKTDCFLSDNQLVVVLSTRIRPENHHKHVVTQVNGLITRLAQQYFEQRCTELAKWIDVNWRVVKIKPFKTRWGSCSSSGELCFNFTLAFAPTHYTEYVIVHELCHRRYMNHSPSFWRLVNQHYSAVDEAKLWFRQHGHTLG